MDNSEHVPNNIQFFPNLKEGYKLNQLSKIKDNLVTALYFTGKSKNPESEWGIEGVTQTYTLLINEEISEVITKITYNINAESKFQI